MWRKMQQQTNQRTAETVDQLWLLEHHPVFTLGQAAKLEHLLDPGGIPVIQVDRGGQVTYHGPGQLMAYLLLDLHRAKQGVKALVRHMEQAIIDLLDSYGILAGSKAGAPGVYVGDKKIAALGLRVRKGCSYHGLSLNVDMDLEPFSRINPCGCPGLETTQLADLGGPTDLDKIGSNLAHCLGQQLNSTIMFHS
ncbi:Octanoate-[acyl-carrier-protein]-protein-N-octanoyltransferase [hydrothermal vent metagenome]|uniref:lipoyl(octanoyl) transferase n=1 Tax=hydrothermal vent metagenome TaxID=652676 RepID=A0A3B1BJ78_9ZZZZ